MGKFKTCFLIAALVCLVQALALSSVKPARAAEPDTTWSAADFAAECSAKTNFTIYSNTLVIGGSATIRSASTCHVHLAPGVSLTFNQVALDSPQGSRVGLVVDGGEGSRVHVHQSSITMAGGLMLAPGGANEPGGAEGNNGFLQVTQSTLRSTYEQGEVRLAASMCAEGGRVLVTQSEISGPAVVYIFAGLTSPEHRCIGSNGTVQLTQSSLTASTSDLIGLIRIFTGQGGQTTAMHNSFSAVGTIIMGGAGCKSLNNSPDIPCVDKE